MKLPAGDRAIVPRAKIRDYLLAPDHPEGEGKARFFLARGYAPGRPGELTEGLREIARTGTLVETIETAYGRKHIVDGVIESPDGTRARLRTVWIVEPEWLRPRFVTAYPR